MSYTYPEKFIRDGVIAPFLLLSVAIVRLPLGDCVHHCAADRLTDCIMSWQVLSLIRPVAFISSHYCNSTDFAMFLPPPHTHTHTHTRTIISDAALLFQAMFTQTLCSQPHNC